MQRTPVVDHQNVSGGPNDLGWGNLVERFREQADKVARASICWFHAAWVESDEALVAVNGWSVKGSSTVANEKDCVCEQKVCTCIKMIPRQYAGGAGARTFLGARQRDEAAWHLPMGDVGVQGLRPATTHSAQRSWRCACLIVHDQVVNQATPRPPGKHATEVRHKVDQFLLCTF
jgi:hypothetical protein